MTLCECGCGGEVKPGNRFIQGHYSKIHPPMKGKKLSKESIQKGIQTQKINKEIREGIHPAPEPKYCACGCGQIVKPGNNYIYNHYGNTKKGKTKYNDEGYMGISIALTGRTKETHKYLIRTGGRRKGLTKETDESIRKHSETLTGRTKETHEYLRSSSEKQTGRTKENYEYLKRRSEKYAGRVGEVSNGWKGGISFLPYCEKFDEDLKERVRNFFGRCCYVCGIGESELNRKLDVHHVNYQKMACCEEEIKPLFVPLCRSCHGKTHGDRQYWEEFFTISLEYLTNSKCFYTKEEIGEKIR